MRGCEELVIVFQGRYFASFLGNGKIGLWSDGPMAEVRQAKWRIG